MKEVKVTITTTTITKKMYGWSKYGGVRDGIVKEELAEWYCQFCGLRQTKGLPCYMIPTDNDRREYLRACVKCKHLSLVTESTTYDTLITQVKR